MEVNGNSAYSEGGQMLDPCLGYFKIMSICQLLRGRVQVRVATCAIRFRAPVLFFDWLVPRRDAGADEAARETLLKPVA